MSLQKDAIYSYQLPADRIAQRPCYPYDAAQLLCIDRQSQSLERSTFTHIADFLQPGDTLVFNDSKVIPARIFARLKNSGGKIELLLLGEDEQDCYRALARPLKKLKIGTMLDCGAGLVAEVLERTAENHVRLRFTCTQGAVSTALTEAGCMPIPPYIRHGQSDEKDEQDYQSIFAKYRGSIAAPTASLHFTPAVIARLEERGISILNCTLHVGTASFLPLVQPDSEHVAAPGAEHFAIPAAVWQTIQERKANGQRIIAVGTTMVRALESRALDREGSTDLFITPGFTFSVCDALITNFHQPATTHLLLVEAFLGRDLLDRAYRYALHENFRFLSYGDGMLVV